MPYCSPYTLRKACEQLKAGQVIAYPTEGVYGLGCDPLQVNAVLKLLHLKNRPVHKGLILIGANLEQLKPYVQLNDTVLARINANLHEPITWLVPAQPWTPNWLTGDHNTLAIRITAHPIASALCRHYKSALVSTSANLNTAPAIKKPHRLIKPFARRGVFIVHGQLGGLTKETAIYDALTYQKLR